MKSLHPILSQVSRVLSLFATLFATTWTYSLLIVLLNPVLFLLTDLSKDDELRLVGDGISEFGNSGYQIFIFLTIAMIVLIVTIDLFLLFRMKLIPSLGDSLLWRNIAIMSPILIYQAVLIGSDATSFISPKLDSSNYMFTDMGDVLLRYTPYIALLLFFPVAGFAYFLIFKGLAKLLQKTNDSVSKPF